MKAEFKDDLSLIEACIKKDMAAWHVFVKKYSPLIYISIKTRLKRYGFVLPHQDIEDIRQDILGSIWQEAKLETVKNRKDISSWLAIVSGNSAIEYMRRRSRKEPVKLISIFDKLNEKEVQDLIASDKSSPNDEAFNDELSKRIGKIIEVLPVKERLIIKLNLLYGKKYHEIAQMLGLPKGTVSSCLKRAKERLREKLKDFLQ